MMDTATDITPWYKQFWPWFIFGLPATVVVAALITVYIAIKGADSLVADDYYKQGLGINRQLAQDEAASTLQLAANIDIDNLVGELRMQLTGDLEHYPSTLTLHWAHPMDQQLDFFIMLRALSGEAVKGQYIGQFNSTLNGRWYLQLSSTEPVAWRLKKQVTIFTQQQSSFTKQQSSNESAPVLQRIELSAKAEH